jgi:hypothetical protein
MTETICKECNKMFEKKRYWQRFCSPVCRTKSFVRTRNEEIAFARKIRAQQSAQPQPVKRDLFSSVAA